MAEPKIFTKNYVSSDDTITVSHGDGSKSYLYDRDNDSKWTTSGANDDATEVSIEVTFKEGTTAVDRTIDSFFLINHNLKNWALEYWDGAAWQSLTSDTVDDQTTTFKSFNEVTTAKVRLTATETQTADAEKFIGEMIVCALQMNVGHEMHSYDPRYRERTREVVLGDGTVQRMITRWTVNRTQKYEARVVFQYLSEAERLVIKAICDSREPFLWQPESSYRPSEIFLVRWANPWDEKYVSNYKGAGSEVRLELKEV